MIKAAYIAEWNFDEIKSQDKKILTHVNFAFAVIKNGKANIEHWKDKEKIKQFNKEKEHIKSVLSIGGWGAGGFSPAVATENGRQELANSLVEISNDYEFDGIDLDWEYPGDDVAGIEASKNDKVNFTLLMNLLREKIGTQKILSMAVGGSQKCIDNLELEKLVNVVDFINLMTYDMCPWDKVGYHTALYDSYQDVSSCDKVVKLYNQAGVPNNKLVLGAAFYSRVYKNVDGIDSKIEKTTPDFLNGGYKASVQFSKECENGEQYDEKAETAWAYNTQKREFITYDNPRSIRAKVEYVNKKKLAGIMFWEYDHDDEESSLIRGLEISI